MLTPEQKAAIRAEEVFRAEIRNEIASAGGHQRRGRKLWLWGLLNGFWGFLNSSFAIWLLSSVVVAAISWWISNAALEREKRETQRRLKWEVYNNGLEFQYAFQLAWTRFQYETAFGEHLQNPKARLVDLKPFTFDRITFEIELLGDRHTAKNLRWATSTVWEDIESCLGGGENDKHDNYYWGLDPQTKTELDETIGPIVRDVIIKPCNPLP